MQPKVIAKGPFKPEDISIKVNKTSERKIATEIEAKLQETWKQIVIEATSKGQKICDGESYRLDNLQLQGDKITLYLSKFKYSIRKPLSELNAEIESYGDEYCSRGLAIGGLIKTTDGLYIFGKRSDKSSTKARIDFIGGVLEEIEIKDGHDLIRKNKEEILEETGIDNSNINNIEILGLVSSNSSIVVIVTVSSLNIDSTKAREIFKSKKDDEMAELIFINSDGLKNYLNELGGYKPTVVNLLEA